jgi:serine/threonine protein phosphatase PrpC
VKESDLILLATDGVFDNLFDSEILEFVSTFTKENRKKSEKTASIFAQALAEKARNKSLKDYVKTPY